MSKFLKFLILLAMIFIVGPGNIHAAKNVTSFDSTQPRGFGGPTDPLHDCSQGPVLNNQGQDLCPIDGGIWTSFIQAKVP